MNRLGLLIVASAWPLLSGCSSDAESSATVWEAPAWMADQAQGRESFISRLQACMDAKSWDLTVDESGGFNEPFSSEEEMMRASDDGQDCLAEQGIDVSALEKPLTEADLSVMYTQDVDTYECLVAQGVEMERTPPGVDLYVEAGLSGQAGAPLPDPWWPYGDQAIMSMPQGEVEQLRQVCPERWVFAGTS